MKTILWLTNIPSPYRVDFFNEFGKCCDLTVLFERHASKERDNSWKRISVENFRAIYLKGIGTRVDASLCPGVIPFLIKNSFDEIIVTNYSDFTGVAAIVLLQLMRRPYIIEGDGGIAGSGKGIKESIKKYIIKNSQLCFSTSGEHDKYYLSYGMKPEGIVRYPFSSLSNRALIQAQLLMQHREKLRDKLGMKEKHVLLSVGRFSYQNGYGKGYDILLNVSKLLGADYGVYIVGDEPTDEFLKMKRDNGLLQVHYIGFKNREDLSEFYCASDCFVFLSRKEAWGLVVNEAMSFGLPIISSEKCIAATELVKNFENGFLVNLDDPAEIAEKIRFIIENEQIRVQYGNNSREKVEKYTIEGMTEAHAKALKLEERDGDESKTYNNR